MTRRKKLLLGGVALLGAAIVAPVLHTEVACRPPAAEAVAYKPLWARAEDRRPEGRTWLTYPEWHIVYSAESYGRFLAEHPPSAFPYMRHVRGFWSSTCALSRVTDTGGASAKVMIYTIGVSYSIELALKAFYENIFGRLTEWLGGWWSPADDYSVRVQQRYGAFMHETPWYLFPFGDALRGLWHVDGAGLRHWERRASLTGEYGVKAGYAKLIGWATGAALGADDRTIRFVAVGDPRAVAAVDPRLRVERTLGGDRLLVAAPRYAQFTDLIGKLAASDVGVIEIAGNDDIFVSVLLPAGGAAPAGAVELLSIPLDDRPGWRRSGLSTKVPRLLDLIRDVRRAGGRLEHVYDY